MSVQINALQDQKRLASWLFDTLKTELVRQCSLDGEIDQEKVLELAGEIQLAIDHFNTTVLLNVVEESQKQLFKNATYLANIRKEPLPAFFSILEKFRQDAQLRRAVFTELRDPQLFSQVYQIPDKLHMLQNLLLLVYRTSLLHLFPQLRQQRAQISSTIEEMACALALNGTVTQLFFATQHWLKNWQEEDFSAELIDALRAKNLLV